MANDGDTRAVLLEQARDLYLRGGLAGLSMRKVAHAAGVSATAIYRHFDSKEALLLAICEEGFQLFARYLWRGLDGATPRERLLATGDGYMRFGIEHTAYYRVMFMSPVEELGFAHMPETTQKKMGPTFQFLVDRVRECMDAGVIAGDDPNPVAAIIWSNSHGLVSLYVSGRLKRYSMDEAAFALFFRRASTALITGLAR